MQKTFLGSELVKEKDKKKAQKKAVMPVSLRALKVLLGVIVGLVVWNLPSSVFGIDNLTVIEQRVIAVFCFATIMWITEGIPSWATSVAIIVVLLFTASDNSLSLFRLHAADDPLFGTLMSRKKIMACFADPAMMLTFLTPVIKSLPANGKGRLALALAIPVGANLGGIATPIGTPPNAIAIKFLNDPNGMAMNIGFSDWMMIMLPLTIVLLVLAWFVIKMLFPFTQKKIELKIEENPTRVLKPWQEITVYVTFALTVLLWMSDKWTHVDANVVAMLPVGVFCVTRIITKYDLAEINWCILWMVAGGFALGLALQDSGLAKHLVESIPFNEWPPVIMIVGSGLICYALANFISHTATANLLIPILALAGMSAAKNLEPFGGVTTLLAGVALGSSLSMILPISTPPNALAHSTGFIEQKDMAKVGIIMGVIGLVLGYTVLVFVGKWGLL